VPAPPVIHTLSLHDALPISFIGAGLLNANVLPGTVDQIRLGVETTQPFNEIEIFQNTVLGVGYVLRIWYAFTEDAALCGDDTGLDRKSTRLNSSHVKSSYAV